MSRVPHVVKLEPAAREWPASTLRLYIQFDRPARGIISQDHLRLSAGDGKPIADPFMDFGQELWSADGKRLTVLFDPGRIKRDVEASGSDASPLLNGQHYRISFDDYVSSFTVTPSERRPLDPSLWVIALPTTSRGALRINFGRLMDTALLQSQISVVDDSGRNIDGTIRVSDDERELSFLPLEHWPSGKANIIVGSALEDVSGNRVGEALDHDVGTNNAEPSPLAIPITVGFTTEKKELVPSSNATGCSIKLYRFEEDCRDLARNGRLSGITRLRYVSLAADNSIWLTFGGEARVRVESLDAPNFGIKGNTAYTARGYRVFAHADLRSQDGWRAFVQVAGGDDKGRSPFERSFDVSAPDLQQAFVEIPLHFVNKSSFVRAGRQEIDFGGTRLVSVRDQANLQLAFDMVLANIRTRRFDLSAFWGRPVVNRRGWFDDTAPATEAFYGLKLTTQPKLGALNLKTDVFLMGRDRALGGYADATGIDHRRTIAVRTTGQSGSTDFLLNGAYQFGSVGKANVNAYAFAGGIGYTFAMSWRPRLGLEAGLASGDLHKGDNQLNSFDPLYPNVGYFTDAPVDDPINWKGFEPSVTLNPSTSVQVKFGADVRYRTTKADGIYNAGRLTLNPGVAAGYYIDTLSFMHFTWHATPHIQFDVGYVHGFAGNALKSSSGHDLNYGLFQMAFRI